MFIIDRQITFCPPTSTTSLPFACLRASVVETLDHAASTRTAERLLDVLAAALNRLVSICGSNQS